MKAIRKWFVLLLVLPIFLFGLLPLSNIRLVQAAENNQLIFTPVADTYINQSTPSTNYGGSTQVRIDGSPLVYSYLRFNLSGLAGRTITKAVFQIYANSNLNGGYQVHLVDDNTWGENTITYANAPSFGSILAASGTINSGQWIQVDITFLITGDGPISLALTDPTVTAVSLASREAKSTPPQLIITFNDSITPSTTSTQTSTQTPTTTFTPSDAATPTLINSMTPTFTLPPTTIPTQMGTGTPTLTPTLVNSKTSTSTPTLTLRPELTPTFTLTPGNNVKTFTSVADTYVDSSNPGLNYGSLTSLRVDGSPYVNSYLRFNVTGLSGSVYQAKLRIYANSASTSGISIAGVTDNSWVEVGMTYGNAPVMGNTVVTSSPVAAGTWKEMDVTSLVSGNGLVSFGIKTSGSTAINLASRESGANAPQLVVTYTTSEQTSTNTPKTTPTNTPINTATGTPTVTPTAEGTPGATPIVILAAGDLTKCAGGTPSPTGGAKITSDMLINDSGLFFTLGDNSNDTGTAADYANCYGPTWGRLKNRTYPAMGNHDQIADSQGGPYFAYFIGMTGNYGHYSLNLGTWHIVVLNAECGVGYQGCGAGSPQEVWLKQDLAANTRQCIMAIWHQPLFSSGTQNETPGMKGFWDDLYAARADIVLNGHNHNYERFALQDPDRNPDPNGIREFVVGTGGASVDSSTKPLALNEEIRSAAAYGYIKLTLQTNSYNWQFIAQPGKSFSDSGSGICH
jgi:hypothetical protein